MFRRADGSDVPRMDQARNRPLQANFKSRLRRRSRNLAVRIKCCPPLKIPSPPGRVRIPSNDRSQHPRAAGPRGGRLGWAGIMVSATPLSAHTDLLNLAGGRRSAGSGGGHARTAGARAVPIAPPVLLAAYLIEQPPLRAHCASRIGKLQSRCQQQLEQRVCGCFRASPAHDGDTGPSCVAPPHAGRAPAVLSYLTWPLGAGAGAHAGHAAVVGERLGGAGAVLACSAAPRGAAVDALAAAHVSAAPVPLPRPLGRLGPVTSDGQRVVALPVAALAPERERAAKRAVERVAVHGLRPRRLLAVRRPVR